MADAITEIISMVRNDAAKENRRLNAQQNAIAFEDAILALVLHWQDVRRNMRRAIEREAEWRTIERNARNERRDAIVKATCHADVRTQTPQSARRRATLGTDR